MTDLETAARAASTATAAVLKAAPTGWTHDAYAAAANTADDLVEALGTIDARAAKLLAPAVAALGELYDYVARDDGPLGEDS